MRAWQKIVIGVIVAPFIFAALLAALWVFSGWVKYPTYAFRYRLTAEVQTPSGLRSGSSVIGVTARHVDTIDVSQFQVHVQGDAIFIDLGDGKNLIVSLAFGPEYGIYNPGVIGKLPAIAFGIRSEKEWGSIKDRKESVQLADSNIPTLISFTDLRDPTTARLVRSDGGCAASSSLPNLNMLGCHTFSEMFGPGYNLKRVTLAITNDPVSRDIDKHFPWWGTPFPWLKKSYDGRSYVDTRPVSTTELRLEEGFLRQ